MAAALWVPIATWMPPRAIDCRMPPAPSATSFSAASSDTMLMTMSRSLQASATVDVVFAPAFSRSAAFPAVRLKTSRSCPPPRSL